MKKLEMGLTLALALGLGAGCAMPPRETSEVSARERAEQTGDSFASVAREALNELNNDFEELVTDNARLDGERAEAWADTREQILEVRQELETDLERLETASRDNSEEIRSRFAQNFETMTHHVERAKLLATDGRDFVSAARQRLEEVDREIQSLQAGAGRLPMEAREDASRAVEDLRSQRNDVEEVVMSIADAAPQEIEEQRDELADDVAALSADVQREGLELQAELDN
jgi:hypothetical protein